MSLRLSECLGKNLMSTPVKFRILSKMNHAEELLKHSNLSIKEIAYELGYCHQFHFSNEFRRISGISPDTFRKKFLIEPQTRKLHKAGSSERKASE